MDHFTNMTTNFAPLMDSLTPEEFNYVKHQGGFPNYWGRGMVTDWMNRLAVYMPLVWYTMPTNYINPAMRQLGVLHPNYAELNITEEPTDILLIKHLHLVDEHLCRAIFRGLTQHNISYDDTEIILVHSWHISLPRYSEDLNIRMINTAANNQNIYNGYINNNINHPIMNDVTHHIPDTDDHTNDILTDDVPVMPQQ